jgi:hypothetical protein
MGLSEEAFDGLGGARLAGELFELRESDWVWGVMVATE